MRRAALAISFVLTTASGSLLANAGFENWLNDSTPEVWRVESRSRTGVELETDTVNSGSRSCRLTRRVAGQGYNSGLLQRVAVVPGRQYVTGLFCLDNNENAAIGIVVSWRDRDSGYLSSTPVRQSSNLPDWQRLTDTVTAPSNAAWADFIIRAYGTTNAPAGISLLVDDAVMQPVGSVPESISIWFVQDSLAARLIDFFRGARRSLDYCCYNSSRPDVNAALIEVHSRGVALRVITDNARLQNQWVMDLRAAGVPVWSDSIGPNSAAYMHNKFAIRDAADADTSDDIVWLATYNPNVNEVHADCALELPGPALARLFQLEFNQMWGDTGRLPNPQLARFHTGKRNVLPTRTANVCGTTVRVFFGPQDRIVDTITALVSQSAREVFFAINSFTYDPLGDAMHNIWQSGRWVGGTIDRAGALDPNSEFPRLRDWGIPILVDSFPAGNGTVHEKFMVIDSSTAIVGSANWSQNANLANDESVIVFNQPDVTNRLIAEAVRRYHESGGNYPPAVIETVHLTLPRTELAPSISVATTGLGGELYDVTGRRADNRFGRVGVYFVARAGRLRKLLLVR